MGSIQYNAALAITCAIRGSFSEKLLSQYRLWNTPATTVVQETLPLVQNNKKLISQVPISVITDC